MSTIFPLESIPVSTPKTTLSSSLKPLVSILIHCIVAAVAAFTSFYNVWLGIGVFLVYTLFLIRESIAFLLYVLTLDFEFDYDIVKEIDKM